MGVMVIFFFGKDMLGVGMLVGYYFFNGVGEFIGMLFVEEVGGFFGFMVIINMVFVGMVCDGLLIWLCDCIFNFDDCFVVLIFVVGEIWDGGFNDIWGMYVK